MPTLLNMEQDPEEAREQTAPGPEDAPKYPWGLALTLDDDVLEKLGMLDHLPSVGDEVIITALACVTGVRSSQTLVGDNESSVTLQITDMACDNSPEDLGQQASRLYGDK